MIPVVPSVLAAAATVGILWWPSEVHADLKYIWPCLILVWCLIALFLTARKDSAAAGSRNPFIVIGGILFVFAILSGGMGVDSYRSAETILLYLSACAWSAGLALCKDEWLVRAVEAAFLGVVACLCAYGVYQYLYTMPQLVVHPEAWSGLSNAEMLAGMSRLSGGRIFSRFALPSAFSCVLLAALPIVHRRLCVSARSWPYAILLAAITACVFLARSYAAVLLFAGYWWIDAWIRHPRFRRTLLVPSAVLIVLVIVFLRPESLLNFSAPTNPIRLRADNWAAAWSEFWSAPLFGVGPGNFGLLFGAHSSGLTETRYAHGVHMTVLAETGLLGFSAWLALTGCFVLWLVRCAPLYGPSLAIIFLYGLLDIVFELPSLCFLFFTLVGLSAAPASRPAPLVRSASAILSAAGAAFSLVLFIAGDYHSQGMSVLQNPRVSRPELRAAADEFEKSRGLWPSPAADAAHGRVNLMRAAVERDPSYVRAAYADFNRAVKKSPATAGFRAGLGETLLAMGDTPLAAVQFKEAARLDPKGPYVEWVLELILGKATERTEDVRTPF